MKTVGSHLASMLRERSVPTRAAPFLKYLAVVVGVVLLYGWLFHVIMAWEGQDHSWFTGIYWALTVMSTLGFGDITFTTDLGRAFSTLVLLTGIVLLLVILPFLFIRLVYAPWLEEQSRRQSRSLRRIPEEMRGHVVVAAADPLAGGLVRRLTLADVPLRIIEPDPDLALRLHEAGMPVLVGEVDAVETYAAARVEDARLVVANASDTVNTSIVLTVRERSAVVPIAAVAEFEDSVDILELSGATHVLPLKLRLGEHLANRVSAGSARANVIGRFHDLLLAEFPVHNTPLQGRTIRQTRLREFTGVTVVGVWEKGKLLPARPELELTPHSVPVVVGTAEQIEELDLLLVIYDANPNPVLVLGGGKVGRAAARGLKRREIAVHIVEKNGALAERIGQIPDRLVVGDAADRRVLEAAGVLEAPSILLTTHDDAVNVYLAVYCRRLNPEARILSRVTHERNVEALYRAGADFVLSYVSLGVQAVFSIVQGRELVVLGEGVDLFYIPTPAVLVGRSLAEAEIGARTGLNVIALQRDGRIVSNPPAAAPLDPRSVLVTIGSAEQREAFDEAFG